MHNSRAPKHSAKVYITSTKSNLWCPQFFQKPNKKFHPDHVLFRKCSGFRFFVCTYTVICRPLRHQVLSILNNSYLAKNAFATNDWFQKLIFSLFKLAVQFRISEASKNQDLFFLTFPSWSNFLCYLVSRFFWWFFWRIFWLFLTIFWRILYGEFLTNSLTNLFD